jgi:phosphotransferase system enzyme I (PtsP)
MDGLPTKKITKHAPKLRGQRRSRPLRQQRAEHTLSLLEDVSTIITHSQDLQETLESIVQIVAERMGTEVCSLYLLDAKVRRLTLWATTGLDRFAIGKVSMRVEEGLTGLVIEKMEPVVAVDAMAHPRFKFFPETGEERYHSFLGIPIVEKHTSLGVLVVQTLRKRRFTRTEIRLLRTISSQVRGIIVQARLLESLQIKERERREYRKRMVEAIEQLRTYQRKQERKAVTAGQVSRMRLSGLGASPGFGMGRAHLIHPQMRFDAIPDRHTDNPTAELERFTSAVQRSTEELGALKERMHSRLPEVDSAIFDAHRLMLEDPTFHTKVETLIHQGLAAESALKKVLEEYIEAFTRTSHLHERTADIRDIGQRVFGHLLGLAEDERALGDKVVFVAEDLSLSDLCLVDHNKLKGVVLASGGVTSHTSILAKSFEIPTVVGVGHAELVREGDFIIADGNAGAVYVNPSAEVIREYERLDREYRVFYRELEGMRDLPTETQDGYRVTLYANIGLLGDVEFARRHGAEGIGLYRTEIPFLTYRDFPSEEEQLDLYRRVLEGMQGRPTTIRTLDIGPDKYPPYLHLPQQDNPFLGWRSIRISLEMKDLFFKAQIKAILRAGTYGPVRILFPMISSLEEIRQVKELLAEAKEELLQEGKAFDPGMPVGMMVEVPSAVWLADWMIQEVDFFSIGTNDLIQYLLAVDRNNHKVSSLYEPLHPAVLTAVHHTIQAAKRAGKGVGMCGEMGADPLCTLVLLGMGLDEMSMEAFFIPVIKRIIRSVSHGAAQKIAQEVLGRETIKEIKGYLFEEMKRLGIIELVEMYH